MTKRTVSLILALCLALSLTVIALAAEPERQAAVSLSAAAEAAAGAAADAAEPTADPLSQMGEQLRQLNRDLRLTVRQTRNAALAANAVKSVLLEQYGGVKTTCEATLYAAADSGAAALRTIPAGKVGRLVDSGDGWRQVRFDACSGYLKAGECQAVRYDDYAHSTAASLVIDDLLAYARTYLGTPYVYGGAGYRGIDCSGFTMQVFGRFGYRLAHGVASQYYACRPVTTAQRRAGDLVFFFDGRYSDGSSPYTHVGIYLGGGRFIHASSSRGVIISSLSDSYYSRVYRCAGRLLG